MKLTLIPDCSFPDSIDLPLVHYTHQASEALFMEKGTPMVVSKTGDREALNFAEAFEWLARMESAEEIASSGHVSNHEGRIGFFNAAAEAFANLEK